jgi:CheY-like chemotaxis protein
VSDELPVVLYVDDNSKSQRLLTGILTHCGFKVIAVDSPEEALRCCRTCRFNLALLDYQMPSMTGSELALQLKSFAPDIPVVLISGYSDLPTSELSHVDAYFGRCTALDDLVYTMRKLIRSTPFTGTDHHATTAWVDST